MEEVPVDDDAGGGGDDLDWDSVPAPMQVDPDGPFGGFAEDDADTRPAAAVAAAVMEIPRLRPTAPQPPSELGLPARPGRGMPHLKDVAKQGIPFAYKSTTEDPAWHDLDKGWCTPAFLHVATRLLKYHDNQGADDMEWMARFLAYSRLPARHQIPVSLDYTANEAATGTHHDARMVTLKQTASNYLGIVHGMVLVVQEACPLEWPGHARIHLWVNADEPKPLWHVLSTLLSFPQWEAAPPFWNASLMDAALASEPHYLGFWKSAYARYQSLLAEASAAPAPNGPE